MHNITIIGIGYTGLIMGVSFANLGNKVVCADIDAEKIAKLSTGVPTIFEKGLKGALKKAIKSKNIEFTTNIASAVKKAEIIFIAVGTPQKPNWDADLSAIDSAAKEIGKAINSYKIIINKSTVPAGTAERVKKIIQKEIEQRVMEKKLKKPVDFAVVSNPEFLAEGSALKDFKKERIVIGTQGEKERKIMENFYKQNFGNTKQILFTDTKSAELTKYASNAMLALRVSFMNEISLLSEKVGANIKDISKGMGMDERIGPKFLSAGAGYGGSCFPKDTRALESMLVKNNCNGAIVKAIDEVNENQKANLVNKVKLLVPNLQGKTISVLGLAYKPNTDDMRESPATVLINALQKEGARVKAYDPQAIENAKKILTNVEYSKNAYDAVTGADAMAIITDWAEFKGMDTGKVKKLMKSPKLFDARNIFNPEEMRSEGFNYVGTGVN